MRPVPLGRVRGRLSQGGPYVNQDAHDHGVSKSCTSCSAAKGVTLTHTLQNFDRLIDEAGYRLGPDLGRPAQHFKAGLQPEAVHRRFGLTQVTPEHAKWDSLDRQKASGNAKPSTRSSKMLGSTRRGPPWGTDPPPHRGSGPREAVGSTTIRRRARARAKPRIPHPVSPA